ncbi:RNA-binding S4 domain-containing protein [Thiolapillus sp.]|uniref:RNA-binding S4 domain-containing protein n=1 Tax=Thiolapillus sp. TaxID=2017437 RepID=UPI003AF5C1BC
MDGQEKMRLDKWLWAARFFKTRKLAAEAISGGKVHLNGQRSKPGKDVRQGNRLTISKNGLHWEIEILQLPRQRRPTSEAVNFYTESETSRKQREDELALLRAARASSPMRTEGRPNKKDRRLIHRFKQEH